MATPRSQNGWPVLDESPPRVNVVPGVDLTIRPGDVAWLLVRVARWVHANVEPLNTPVVEGGKLLKTDDWGWAKRNVRGSSTTYSNHASATAVDLNATQHPRGVKRTWTAAEVAKIDRHLAEYDGAVRWGEHYTSTVDGMHFEINTDPAGVRRVRDKLQALDAERARLTNEEDEMFMAGVAGEDKRVFLVGPNGKTTVPSSEVFAELKRAGIPYRGEMSSAALAMFPTLDGSHQAEVAARGRVEQMLASLAGVTAGIQTDVRELEATVAALGNIPPADGAGG